MMKFRGMEWVPLPINLGISCQYGISSDVNIGGVIYPFALFTGKLAIEPTVTYGIIKNDSTTALNIYTSLPVNYEFGKGFEVSTMIGISPVFQLPLGRMFITPELKISYNDICEGSFPTFQF
ncbi:MAG: hypothetical protein IPL53_21425 [Ignavibacteria bacterium]|nr:hypothetical protein [Ignavibacteria bacterium]